MAHPVPQAKTALKALIDARPAWDTVDIRDGQWTEQEDITRDVFWFEATEIPEDTWNALGGQQRIIEFRLAFTIVILREGDDERACEDAMWTLLEDLMAAVRGDYRLGGAISQVGDLRGRQENAPYSPGIWQAAFRGSLGCTSNPY